MKEPIRSTTAVAHFVSATYQGQRQRSESSTTREPPPRHLVALAFCALCFLASPITIAVPTDAAANDPDIQRAADSIHNIQKEIRYWRSQGDVVKVLELQEQAQMVWNNAMARAQERVEAKRRAELALKQINDSERAAALEHSFAVGNKAFEAAKAGNEWRNACFGGPAACLLAINKAKGAIEEGFAGAEEALEVKVHAATAAGAETLRQEKALERATIEKQADHLEGHGGPVRYDRAMSRNPTPPAEAPMTPGPMAPVRMGGEQVGAEAETPEKDAQRRLDAFRQQAEATTKQAGSQVPSVTEDSATAGELDNAAATLQGQGQSTQRANAPAVKASPRNKDFPSQFSEESRKTFNRLQDEADKESDRGASAKEDFDKAQAAAVAKTAAEAPAPRNENPPSAPPIQALPIVTPVPTPTTQAKGTSAGVPEKPEAIDHCPNGAFICPNGNPWPKCTHPEKYDCPPAEYTAQAQKELSTGTAKAKPTMVPTKRP